MVNLAKKEFVEKNYGSNANIAVYGTSLIGSVGVMPGIVLCSDLRYLSERHLIIPDCTVIINGKKLERKDVEGRIEWLYDGRWVKDYEPHEKALDLLYFAKKCRYQ
jgi:hypothetical protein